MGKALSVVKHPFRNFNLESRAFKVISKEKPVPAPKHKSDQEEYERLMQSLPEMHRKKDGVLDKNLRDVFVNSRDPELIRLRCTDPERPLPMNRDVVEDFEMGFREPLKVKLGRITLRKALRFISEHQADPSMHSVKKVAEEHFIPEEKVGNILKYFRVYQIYYPDKPNKAIFAEPSIPATIVSTHKPKQIV